MRILPQLQWREKSKTSFNHPAVVGSHSAFQDDTTCSALQTGSYNFDRVLLKMEKERAQALAYITEAEGLLRKDGHTLDDDSHTMPATAPTAAQHEDWMERMVSCMTSTSPAGQGQFVADCLQQRRYNCVVTVALYLKDDQILRSLPDLEEEFLDDWLVHLAGQKKWRSVSKLLPLCPGYFSAELLSGLTAKALTEDSEAVLKSMLQRCTQGSVGLVMELIRHIAFMGYSRHLEQFLYAHNQNVRQAVERLSTQTSFLSDIVERSCTHRLHESFNLEKHASYHGCLCVACEAGLYTLSVGSTAEEVDCETPLSLAVSYNQPDLVRFLYNAGATDNQEVVGLSRSPWLQDRASNGDEQASEQCVRPPQTNFPPEDDAEAAREILDFLSRKSSRPCSLQSSCIWAVSKQAGWGHVRAPAIRQLQIPDALKDLVSCKGCSRLLTPERDSAR